MGRKGIAHTNTCIYKFYIDKLQTYLYHIHIYIYNINDKLILYILRFEISITPEIPDQLQPLSDMSIIYLLCHRRSCLKKLYIIKYISSSDFLDKCILSITYFILTAQCKILISVNSTVINRLDPGDEAPGSRRLLSA